MDDLILVAASGLAREAIEAARAQGRYDVVGLVDDDATRQGEIVGGVKVLGGLDVIADHPSANVVICAGKGSSRASIRDRLSLDERRYGNIVHPSVEVAASCEIGVGSVILAGTVLTADVSIGQHVVVMPNAVLTHDDVVADLATLCAGVLLGGNVRVGRQAYLGMGAVVRERVHIGSDAVIGMGAVVITDVPAGEVWFGNPARARTR